MLNVPVMIDGEEGFKLIYGNWVSSNIEFHELSIRTTQGLWVTDVIPTQIYIK